MLARVLRYAVQYETQGKESAVFTDLLAGASIPNLPTFDDIVRDSSLKGWEQLPSESVRHRDSVGGDAVVSGSGPTSALSSVKGDVTTKPTLFHVSSSHMSSKVMLFVHCSSICDWMTPCAYAVALAHNVGRRHRELAIAWSVRQRGP